MGHSCTQGSQADSLRVVWCFEWVPFRWFRRRDVACLVTHLLNYMTGTQQLHLSPLKKNMHVFCDSMLQTLHLRIQLPQKSERSLQVSYMRIRSPALTTSWPAAGQQICTSLGRIFCAFMQFTGQQCSLLLVSYPWVPFPLCILQRKGTKFSTLKSNVRNVISRSRNSSTVLQG